jgi:hypothetical protein
MRHLKVEVGKEGIPRETWLSSLFLKMVPSLGDRFTLSNIIAICV